MHHALAAPLEAFLLHGPVRSVALALHKPVQVDIHRPHRIMHPAAPRVEHRSRRTPHPNPGTVGPSEEPWRRSTTRISSRAGRAYFISGATRGADWRRGQLEALKALLEENRESFLAVLRDDLHRNDVDSELMDVGFCVKEAEYALKHMHDWMKPEREPTPVILEPGHVRVRRDPLGVTLIIGAWNEPLMLTFGPLAPALAAGNTAVIKPSELVRPRLRSIASSYRSTSTRRRSPSSKGAIPETTALLDAALGPHLLHRQPRVGKIIHQAAAKQPDARRAGARRQEPDHRPCVGGHQVRGRRIAYGRFINSGQICTAPDHVLVWPDVKDELVEHLGPGRRTTSTAMTRKTSPDYGRVVNRKAAERLAGPARQRQGRGRRRASISTTGTSRRPCWSMWRGTRPS